MSRRSVLFTPGDRPDMLETALEAGADVVVFDLEDAVAPDRKETAREAVVEALESLEPDDERACERCVRINPDPDLEVDLEAILHGRARERLDGVVLPKASAAEDVASLASALEARDAEASILALIETARGVLAADEIAAEPAVDALLFGAEDLAADVGASRTPEGTEVLYARQRVVIAAAAHGCTAVDTVFTDFEDVAGLRAEAAEARRMGYDGKLAIHPRQIDPIHGAFAPDPAEHEWAKRVLEGAEAADATGRGAFEVDGEMIDRPLLERARRIVELAEE